MIVNHNEKTENNISGIESSLPKPEFNVVCSKEELEQKLLETQRSIERGEYYTEEEFINIKRNNGHF